MRPTKIIGDGTLTTSCDTEYSDLYHESSLLIEDCDISVGAFRGVFSAFLEIRKAKVNSERGIYWHSGLSLKNCAIVEPKEGIYDGVEHAVAVNGWIYKRNVRIDRTYHLGIENRKGYDSEKKIFDIQGRLLTKPQKGICIIKHADGKAEKTIR